MFPNDLEYVCAFYIYLYKEPIYTPVVSYVLSKKLKPIQEVLFTKTKLKKKKLEYEKSVPFFTILIKTPIGTGDTKTPLAINSFLLNEKTTSGAEFPGRGRI